MGLFDKIRGPLNDLIGQAAANAPELISAGLAKTNLGDLQGLMTKLQQGGLDEQVKSWLGKGVNLPISAEQLQAALGNNQIKQLAEQFGVPTDAVLKMLAEHLPATVDQASPDGSLQS